MSKHGTLSEHYAAGAPIRRARAWAWIVFWSMASTGVLYNCYHSLVISHMPWYTGLPEGVVPLLLAIGVLEIASAWTENQWVAWLITLGAMAWSSVAIGAVIGNGAPAHGTGFLFGLLSDSAALYAVHFLLNGPRAAAAVAAIDAKVAGLTAALEEAERSAGERVGALRAELTGELEARDRALADAEKAVAAARSDAEKATEKAAVLERKLAGPARRSAAGPERHGTAPRTAGTGTASKTAPEDDLELEAQALKLLATDLDMSGAELARRLHISAGYGRKLRRRLTGDRPGDAVPDRPENRAGTAREDRSEDRA